jgi:hypothetical protein
VKIESAVATPVEFTGQNFGQVFHRFVLKVLNQLGQVVCVEKEISERDLRFNVGPTGDTDLLRGPLLA